MDTRFLEYLPKEVKEAIAKAKTTYEAEAKARAEAYNKEIETVKSFVSSLKGLKTFKVIDGVLVLGRQASKEGRTTSASLPLTIYDDKGLVIGNIPVGLGRQWCNEQGIIDEGASSHADVKRYCKTKGWTVKEG